MVIVTSSLQSLLKSGDHFRDPTRPAVRLVIPLRPCKHGRVCDAARDHVNIPRFERFRQFRLGNPSDVIEVVPRVETFRLPTSLLPTLETLVTTPRILMRRRRLSRAGEVTNFAVTATSAAIRPPIAAFPAFVADGRIQGLGSGRMRGRSGAAVGHVADGSLGAVGMMMEAGMKVAGMISTGRGGGMPGEVLHGMSRSERRAERMTSLGMIVVTTVGTQNRRRRRTFELSAPHKHLVEGIIPVGAESRVDAIRISGIASMQIFFGEAVRSAVRRKSRLQTHFGQADRQSVRRRFRRPLLLLAARAGFDERIDIFG